MYDRGERTIEPTLENKEKFIYFLLRGRIRPKSLIRFESGHSIMDGFKGLLGLRTFEEAEVDNKALQNAAKVTSALENGSLSVNYEC